MQISLQRGSGGIGRRASLRSLWPQGREGSSPFFRTIDCDADRRYFTTIFATLSVYSLARRIAAMCGGCANGTTCASETRSIKGTQHGGDHRDDQTADRQGLRVYRDERRHRDFFHQSALQGARYDSSGKGSASAYDRTGPEGATRRKRARRIAAAKRRDQPLRIRRDVAISFWRVSRICLYGSKCVAREQSHARSARSPRSVLPRDRQGASSTGSSGGIEDQVGGERCGQVVDCLRRRMPTSMPSISPDSDGQCDYKDVGVEPRYFIVRKRAADNSRPALPRA